MLNLIVLFPIVFLLVGGLLFVALARKLPASAQPWLAIVFIALEILTLGLNIFPSPHRIEISKWEAVSFTIGFQMGGISVLLLFILFIVLLAFQLINPERALNRREHFFALTSAALLTSASNLYTVYLAWTLMDFAFFALRRATGVDSAASLRALIVGQIAGLMLFVGAIFPGTVITGASGSLVALALWARLGLFPFHWVLPRDDLDQLDVWIARGVPFLAGASLWLHWKLWNVEAPAGLIATLNLMTLIAALVWLRREEQTGGVVSMNIMSAAAFIPLSVIIGGEGSIAPALWMTLGIFLMIAAFNIAEGWLSEQSRRVRVVWLAGLVGLAGFPLTPAFLGRADALVWLWNLGQPLFLLVAVGMTTLMLAPLWKISVTGELARAPSFFENVGLGIYGVIYAALTLAPTVIVGMLDPMLADSVESTLDRVVRTNDALGMIVVSLALILPILVSFLLSRTDIVSFQPSSATLFFSRLFDLEWFATAITRGGIAASSAVRKISVLAEENPTIWILFVFLWIAIFLLTSR